MTTRFDTILITGAAGRLGTELRRGLAPLARRLRLADLTEIKDLQSNEEALIFDLSDEAAVMSACEGVDAIVHFGGAPLETSWETILSANIRGSYHIYEAARKNGVKRVIYASSVHAVGYHRLDDHIDANARQRPDSLYGLSKCFVENLGQLYWDKFGIETVALRIFSSFPEPADRRMLWSWLSFDDCVRLVTASLTANADFKGSVLVIERDPTYQFAATSLSSSSIRVQFSNPINVRISQYGSEFIRDFARTMQVAGEPAPDLGFHSGGYLFLANSEAQASALRENHEVQRACGADVVLLGQEELARAFPHLNVNDIQLASYGQTGEGWFNNTGLMYGFKDKAREQGAEYLTDEVVAIGRDGKRVTTVTLKSGMIINAGTIVNASGPRAALTARMAGLDVPVEPRKRTLFVFDCARTPEGSAQVNGGRLPLMIDPSGVFCRPEGQFFLAGCPPVDDPAVDWDDYEPRYEEFVEIIWPALAERSEAFEAIKVVNQWAGHYDFNTLDHNLIVSRDPVVTNFIYANGYSGHGLQQGPAAGRGVSELIIYDGFRTLDMTEVGYERVVENRPFLEKAVI